MLKPSLTLLFLLVFQLVYSQELFTVLITSNCYKSNDSLLVEGKRLNKGEKVKVMSGGYLGLIHISGKTLELSHAGVFKVDSLSNLLQPNTESIHPIYLSLSGFVKPYVFVQWSNKYPTGSVERDGIYRLHAASRNYVYPDSVFLQWCPIVNVKGYELKLVDMYDEEVYQTTTGKEEVMIYLNKVDFMKLDDRSAKIFLAAQNDPRLITDDTYFLVLPTEEKLAVLRQRLLEFKTLNPTFSNLNYYALGLLYEKDNLYLNAYTQYQHIIKANETYSNRYKLFLRVSGLGFDCY